MSEPEPIASGQGWAEEVPMRDLWQGAVGKVFKLTSKPHGVRDVTYTHIKGVRDVGIGGAFDIEVSCIEVVARVPEGKRMYSNICKEGVLHQTADSLLLPAGFGSECPRAEFDKVTEAIVAYTNTYLDWAMEDQPEQQTEIGLPLDLPHLVLTDMEASLVRHSPFLVKGRYLLSPNSIAAARVSLRQEMQRAWRNINLPDAVDAAYVEKKNEAAASLNAKLAAAQREAASRKGGGGNALQLDSLCLALLGQPAATTISWVTANPSEDGPVCCIGLACTPLDFVRWAHVSGKLVPVELASRKRLMDFFGGWNQAYTGPDADGVYPLLKPATG